MLKKPKGLLEQAAERMNEMRAWCKTMLLALSLTALLSVAVLGADYEEAANDLKNIGLLRGAGREAGFALDRAPTRTEAAVMLVRLLGAEQSAQTQFAAGAISQPFSDVADWAEAYVAWLYQNGLTQGIGNGKFGGGSNDLCSEKMYVTFLLRTLGYDDLQAGDFTYDAALDFAAGLGLYDKDLLGDVFLRDQLAALTLQTLATSPKGEVWSLLEKLVAEGAVDQTMAKPLLEKVADYRHWLADSAEQEQQTDLSLSMEIQIDSTTDESTPLSTFLTMESKIKQQSDGTLAAAYRIFQDTGLGFSLNLEGWEKDGWRYLKRNELWVKEPSSPEQNWRMMPVWSVEPLYQFKSLLREQSVEGVSYQMVWNLAAEGLLSVLGWEQGRVINDVNATAHFGTDGLLQTMALSFQQRQQDDTEAKVKVLCTYHAFGEAVSIDWPDFSRFVLNET